MKIILKIINIVDWSHTKVLLAEDKMPDMYK